MRAAWVYPAVGYAIYMDSYLESPHVTEMAEMVQICADAAGLDSQMV